MLPSGSWVNKAALPDALIWIGYPACCSFYLANFKSFIAKAK
jgi:hypothetical protein